ncbi:MAG: hypothetical protein MHM6MM_007424, partial [Cercozoa sp. M6MM]
MTVSESTSSSDGFVPAHAREMRRASAAERDFAALMVDADERERHPLSAGRVRERITRISFDRYLHKTLQVGKGGRWGVYGYRLLSMTRWGRMVRALSARMFALAFFGQLRVQQVPLLRQDVAVDSDAVAEVLDSDASPSATPEEAPSSDFLRYRADSLPQLFRHSPLGHAGRADGRRLPHEHVHTDRVSDEHRKLLLRSGNFDCCVWLETATFRQLRVMRSVTFWVFLFGAALLVAETVASVYAREECSWCRSLDGVMSVTTTVLRPLTLLIAAVALVVYVHRLCLERPSSSRQRHLVVEQKWTMWLLCGIVLLQNPLLLLPESERLLRESAGMALASSACFMAGVSVLLLFHLLLVDRFALLSRRRPRSTLHSLPQW